MLNQIVYGHLSFNIFFFKFKSSKLPSSLLSLFIPIFPIIEAISMVQSLEFVQRFICWNMFRGVWTLKGGKAFKRLINHEEPTFRLDSVVLGWPSLFLKEAVVKEPTMSLLSFFFCTPPSPLPPLPHVTIELDGGTIERTLWI